MMVMAVTKTYAKQRGVTLIELLVSMLIGLFLIAGVVQSVVSAKHSYLHQDEFARMQENGRYALEYLTSEVRMAGYTGCSQASRTAVAVENTDWRTSIQGLGGYEGGVDTLPDEFNSVLGDADVIVLSRKDSSSALTVSSHQANSAVIHIDGSHNISPGSILVASNENCEEVSIFQLTGPNGLPANHLNHGTGGSTQPGNCTKASRAPDFTFDCSGVYPSNSDINGTYEMGPGWTISQVQTLGLYIGSGASGQPALFRERVNTSGGDVNSVAEELVEGIENMQIRYGEDLTPTDSDGNPNVYRKANDVSDWDAVKTVRIELLLRSSAEILPEPQSITFDGTVLDSDKFARKIITTTIAIRNRS